MPQVIAEVKTHSPFGWTSDYTWDELFAVAEDVGDIVSIHTDPRWHGSFELVRRARARTGKPILAKGIHTTDEEITHAIECGADLVLVVGRIPAIHLDECLLEVNELADLDMLPAGAKAVWNARDLTNGEPKTESFAQARQRYAGWLCQASNITHLADINQSADAVLIGTHLPELASELRSISHLGGKK